MKRILLVLLMAVFGCDKREQSGHYGDPLPEGMSEQDYEDMMAVGEENLGERE